MATLDRLLLTGVEYLYGAHQQGAQQTTVNERTSTFPKLKLMLKLGSKLNQKHSKRLEKVFKTLRVQPQGHADAGMQGIIEANNNLIADKVNAAERDLINIAFGQAAAHLYIAKYGTMRTYAEKLGNKKAAHLLQITSREMGALDKKLTELAHEVMAQAVVRKKKKKSAAGSLLKLALGVGAAAALAQVTLNTQARPREEPASSH